MQILRFDTLDSTNGYCRLLDLNGVGEFAVVWALAQPAGVGQRGNSWISQPGKNLTFSLILHPSFLQPSAQFLLTKVLSLGISDWLLSQIPSAPVAIKWPNDLYVGYRKMGGILVENSISTHLDSSVCGIGLNINQTLFPDSLPNPVSLSQLTGRVYALEDSLRAIVECVRRRYEQLRNGEVSVLDNDYWDRLLFHDRLADYQYQGRTIRARITGIDAMGHLRLQTTSGESLVCDLKEIAFLMPSE